MSEARLWRVGRKVGRTIYELVGDEPSDGDRLIGMMDTPDLARSVVEAREVHVRLFAGAEERLKEPAVRDDPMRLAAVNREPGHKLDAVVSIPDLPVPDGPAPGTPVMVAMTTAEFEAVDEAVRADERRAVADEVQDALGDTELLPAGVRDRFDDLLHRLRTGRDT